MSEGLYALIGVILGGVLGIMGPQLQVYFQDKREKKAVAAAIAAEILSLKENATRRGFEEYYESVLMKWKKGELLDWLPDISGAADNQTPIALAYIGRIGCLKPADIADIVLFYSRFDQINGTIVLLASKYYKTIEDKIRVVESELKLSKENFQLADEIVCRLNKY